MATALTSELTRFTDKCNNVLAGGIVKTFEPNSLTPKTSYQDPECTIPNLPEVNLDETGRARIYIQGDYRVQVYSRDGVLIEDNLLVEQSLVQRDFVELSQSLQVEQQATLNQFQAKADDVIAKGFYTGYATETALKASLPAVSEMRARADDTRKIWRWNRTSAEGVTPVTGTWTDTGLSDKDLAAADASTKANAAESNAKTYADQNKLDIKKIQHSYQDGNLIGPKSARYLNFGVTSGFLLRAENYYDSCVIPVDAGDVLFILNDKQIYAAPNGAAYAFFAEDPYLNRSQARIVDNRTSSITNPETSLSYVQVTVPTGANYLILNTRYNNAAGTISNVFNWAIHSGAFNSSYEQGTEVITRINDVKVPTVIEVEKLSVEKLGISEIETYYSDGNLIGPNSKKVNNFGLTDLRTLSSNTVADSTIISVDAGDKLFIYNDKNSISAPIRATFAFFAENPYLNQSQTRIVHTEVSRTDTGSGAIYREVVVPVGAKFLVLNHRVTLVASGTVDYNWAVHKRAFVYSFEAGREYIKRIKGLSLSEFGDLGENKPIKSLKNLYVGSVIEKITTDDSGAYNSANVNDVLSPFIPVEFGKTYTISGMSVEKMGAGTVRVLGFNSPTTPRAAVKLLGSVRGGTSITVTIDDATITHIAFPLTRNNYGTVEDAERLPIQVEVGASATTYEPSDHTKALLRAISKVEGSETSSNLNLVSQFTQLDAVRDPLLSTLAPISKTVGAYGLNYKLSGAQNTENASNNLYGQLSFESKGKKSINVNIMKRVDGGRAVGALKRTAFTVPSGALDNPGSFPFVDQYPKDLYVHPSIAYSSTGVAGFKYWMISSVFPPTSEGGALWEDEDLFVSNDAVNWQRVRSMYETDKSYTTATLRLPPQTLVTNNARKHNFLPCPALGDSIEVSVPASNGMPAMDRVTITLNEQLPWKHDPFILIDGGYVYTYHTFHLPTKERTGGKNRFIVCVRTSNGVDWDVVRSDGSTMRITEETSRQIFTKDAQGRYNFIYYGYNLSGSNPEIIKFGEGDYEFFYGSNFAVKFTGSTPYTFDFSNRIPIQSTTAGNHPTIINYGGVLYLLTNDKVYRSENRGVNWTALPNYPMWLGGIAGMSYKKATCVGADGKFLLIDIQRCFAPAQSLWEFNIINDVNNLFIYEYPSLTDFLDKANNGLVDAYIDLQITKVNPIKGSREVIQLPYITPTQVSGTGLEVTQRLKIGDITVESGDIVYLHVTLNSRKGAEIIFGGIDIS